MRDERGQILTIEGIVSAFIIVFVLVVIVQTTSVTPLSSSFTNQHIKLELQNIGNDILSTLDETPLTRTGDPSTPSLLKESVVQWALTDSYNMFTWNNTSFISTISNGATMTNSNLTRAFTFALIGRGIAFNLEARYPDASNYLHTNKMIWNGDPSENSVIVSRYIMLHDSDIYNDSRVIPDMSPATGLHSTVELRLTLWVM